MSKFGRKRYRSHDSRGVLPGKRHISERPPEVELRQRIGHWEGDTVMGSDMRHCILTLVERMTGYAIIKKLNGRNKDEVTRAATRAIRKPLPQVQDASRSTTAPNSTTTKCSSNASPSRSTSPRPITRGSGAATRT